MSILDNFTETVNSDNRFSYLNKECEDDIVIGGNCKHKFTFPFVFSSYATSLGVCYKQGLTIILNKTYPDTEDTSITVDEETLPGSTIVTVKLDAADTIQFANADLETYVQLKIITKDSQVLYDIPYRIQVIAPLEEIAVN